MLHIKFQMVWELPRSNWRLYTYVEWSLCYFIVHRKKPSCKSCIFLKVYFDIEFEDSIPTSGKNKVASCSYCLIYHPNVCFYHLGYGFECKNSQHPCQHNNKSKDNTKLTVIRSIKMELCKISGFGNNVVKYCIVLGHGAASLGHWCVMIRDQWRTQEFFSGGGFNKFSWGHRTERTGIWGQKPLSQGFWRQL